MTTAKPTAKSKEKHRIVVSVIDVSNAEVEKMELDPKVFDGKVRAGSVYRAVHNYLASQRYGNASTKTRGDVAGSGRKPWRQKGTGRARVGSIRTPLWRHGGTVFGPHPRDFSYHLPHGIKRLALKSMLNDRALSNDIIVLSALSLETAKTKNFQAILKKLKLNDKILFVLSSISDNVLLSSRNIDRVKVVDAKSLNAYDVVSSKKVLFTREALQQVIARIK